MVIMAYGYGKGLEQLILYANDQYRSRELADIQKIPVPTVVDRETGKGFRNEKSIVDFIGFYRHKELIDGKSIKVFKPVAFDSKETRKTTRFDLSGIYEHQYHYLKFRYQMGTEAFLIINLVESMHQVFLLNKSFGK